MTGGPGAAKVFLSSFPVSGYWEKVGAMGAEGTVKVRVSPVVDSDAEELAELSIKLRAELMELDVLAVTAEASDGAPRDEAIANTRKGIGALAAGRWLAVQLGAAGLRSVLAALADWATRNNREVEVGVTIGTDTRTLKLSRATPEQQERMVDAWLASLPASP
jgi:hypothetical protein